MTDRSISAQNAQAANMAVILILGSLTAFGPLSIDMYLPAFPVIEGELHTNASMVQLSLTACLMGLALGQMVAGPVSDQKGRRGPLLIGLTVYVVSSLLCALLPSIEALIVCRFIQGVSGAAGIVISRAISRDMYAGAALTRFSATLMLVNGAAPILAPIIGGQLLQVMSWRGIFVVLAAIGAVMLVSVWFGLRETLPENRRSGGGFGKTLADIVTLLRDRRFVGLALSQGFVMASMFAYISGSPFVLQNLYGASPQMFSVFFAANAIGIVAFGQFTGRTAGRIPEQRLFVTGISMAVLGGTALLISVLSGAGLVFVLPSIFIAVASVGMVTTTGFSLAMHHYGRSAGSAAALLGVLSFVFGGTVAPLVGIAGTQTAIPMGIVMAGCVWLSAICYRVLVQGRA
ncbi:Bcr/CflA family efflux MFS transporter [Cohnella sp. CFH 77786]|uniref:multidrug effflux MFS transporter n=1 Tax=Cohnella sp. CFH 77786 TaxID=2662265 RepID=UPI001C60DF77|nr:multidrug effflux MFS transporter [Cohnella sp. CFH 77786]MBW5447322.1 Bcr/CflA family efflux MFS transporter [Cohnella sp. CFH 77786]